MNISKLRQISTKLIISTTKEKPKSYIKIAIVDIDEIIKSNLLGKYQIMGTIEW